MKYVIKDIIKNSNKYLLQLRDNNPNIVYPNNWSFFGGEKQIGETCWECLRRELSEEMSWTLQNGKYSHSFKNNDFICLIYYY